MNLRATQAEPTPQPKAGPLKFTYPSGSRPLDGYTIKRGIGRGGFGEVYYALSDAGKEVALKLIRRNLDVELRGVTQCLNLKHPNLLGLYDIRQDDLGDSWVVMEYVAGDCLEDVVSRHPAGLPRDQALRWFHGIAAGVAYLHDHGIVHRDLKPGNIFCDEGLIKIGDYGLSKFISASRRSGQTESVGTVHYMAPEIGNGRYGKEIDIYALGIILYELLTGRVPFEGESVGEVLMKHLTAEPDLSGVEEPYRTAIAQTLTKSPEGRLQTVQELVDLLPALPENTAAFPAAVLQRSPADLPPLLGQAGRQVAGNQVSRAELVEEPLWRGLRTGWGRFREAWNSGRIPTLGRIGIVGGSIFLVISLWWLLLPAALWLMVIYGAYCAIRAIALANGPGVPSGKPVPAATIAAQAKAPPAPVAGITPAAPQAERMPAALPNVTKTARQRAQELTGSMLISAAVAMVMCLLLNILRGKAAAPEQFAWLTLVGTVGAWAVMLPAKFWEGSDGEATLRRCLMLLLGLGVGAFAYTSKAWLLVDLPYDWRNVHIDERLYPQSLINFEFSDATGAPTLMGHLAYFGFLLAALRWWRQADFVRPLRLSPWSAAVSVFVAWLLSLFWPFPQPWGMMIAATISVAVQLASPWQPLRRRRPPSYV